jgi:hypothetical protein
MSGTAVPTAALGSRNRSSHDAGLTIRGARVLTITAVHGVAAASVTQHAQLAEPALSARVLDVCIDLNEKFRSVQHRRCGPVCQLCICQAVTAATIHALRVGIHGVPVRIRYTRQILRDFR